jgi:hypothetical protein
MDETAIKSALRAWVRKASGLNDKKVIWSEQSQPRLEAPFITMRLGDFIPLGSADEVTQEYDPLAPPGSGDTPGEEITITVNGRRSVSLSVQVFGAGAQQTLSKVQTSLGLPSVKEGLEAVGVSVYDIGEVQNVTGLLETVFEPRALTNFSLYVSETVSEKNTFIESVGVTNEINNKTFIIEEPA